MAQAAHTPELSLESWEAGHGIEFKDSEAERAYQRRASRFADAIRGDDPDRVPVNLLSTFYPVFHAGITPEEAMNDADKLSAALHTFVDDLEPDLLPWATALIPSAKALDIVDYRVFDWPGAGSSPDTVYQCKEKEYMGVDDYDDLIADPSNYFLTEYIPEVFGGLEGLSQFPEFTNLTGGIAGVHPYLLPFGLPPVREAMQNLLDAGEEALRWQQLVGGTVEEIVTSGYPQSFGGITIAPYDMLGDTVRGTRGIMMDLKRRPETLLEALERLTPRAIDMGIGSAYASGNPHVFIPLHKGADGFMPEEEFNTFYWPQLREVIDGLTDAGLVPWLFAEGGYNSRLDVISDQPDGNIVWQFDRTDMVEAKKVLGDQVAIAGNVHSSLLNTETPEDVSEYCEELIEDVGPDGFILAPGVALDEAEPENVKAMMDSVK